jgi:RNA polymerase sigma-70 factor (family 1)
MKQEIRRLVERMADDDHKAFRQFFDLQYTHYFRFAYYFLPSSALCEELVSDVFMKIWNNRKNLPKIEHLEVYFLQSVKNQALTYIKRQAQNREYSPEISIMPAVTVAHPENLMIAQELADKLDEAIKSLPPKCETVFRLVRENGLSYKEAAAILEISPRTVDNQMLIAMKRIKEVIENFYSNSPSKYGKLRVLRFFLSL